MPSQEQVFISIGSNINPDQYIPNSINALKFYYGALDISPIYESIAEGFKGDNFYNLVVSFFTDHSAEQVYQQLRTIENDNQRQRSAQKFSARTLDLDLLLYGQQCLNTAHFILPRDEILKYAFVLKPLADIALQNQHPETQQSYADLWVEFQQTPQYQSQNMWEINL
jgi:2-amino-4-hydroxy-6-hydroxymethyldihydropteridine diphosphokinase